MSLLIKPAERRDAPRRGWLRALSAGLALAGALALLAGFAAVADPASPAPERAGASSFHTGPLADEPPQRHLILLPGGGFTRYDPTFESQMVFEAQLAGFVPHYVPYRLGNLGAAVRDARAAAGHLGAQFGTENVFAYGSSAGGTLATLLAGEGRVSAAVASSALYDFQRWPWADIFWGPQYFEEIKADLETRRLLSPMRRPLRCPVLAMHGELDPIVSVFQAEDYAFIYRRATLRIFAGGHGLYKRRPGTVPVGMHWLHQTARIQEREAERRIVRLSQRTGKLRQLANRGHRKFRVEHGPRLCSDGTAVSISRLASLSSRR